MTNEKIEALIEKTEKDMKRPLTDKEKEQFYVRFGNMVAKKVELRDGEVDLRELPKKDLIQLEDRNIRDLIGYNKFLVGQLNDITNLLCVLLIKLGVSDPLKEVSEFETKMREEQFGKEKKE